MKNVLKICLSSRKRYADAHNSKDHVYIFRNYIGKWNEFFFKHNSCCMVRHLYSEIMLTGFVKTSPLQLCSPSTENQIFHYILEKKFISEKIKNVFQISSSSVREIIMYANGKLSLI